MGAGIAPLRTLRWLGAAAVLAFTPIACVDLFHSTSSFENACAIDAAACAPAPMPASDGGPTDFCQWNAATASANAMHACAWLGACSGPIGDDAFGPCYVRAMLAYDCAANPNHALVPGSPAHAIWDRLWQARSCADVSAATLPPKLVPACGSSPTAYESCFLDAGVLLSCAADDGGAPGTFEDCNAFGQTCTASGAVAGCTGPAGVCSTPGSQCVGNQLEDCDPDAGPFDFGIDCANVGAGSCVTGANGTASACKAASSAPCAATNALTCGGDAGDLVQGCPSGVAETIECAAILGLPPGTPGACKADAGGRPWDVSRGCFLEPCSGGDQCDGAELDSCARGASITFNCGANGFSGCGTVGDPARAACIP